MWSRSARRLTAVVTAAARGGLARRRLLASSAADWAAQFQMLPEVAQARAKGVADTRAALPLLQRSLDICAGAFPEVSRTARKYGHKTVHGDDPRSHYPGTI
jgi:hypothetical protein